MQEPIITIARWQGLQGSEREHLVLAETEDSIVAESVYISTGGSGAFAVHYRLVCNPDWTVRQLDSHVMGSNSRLQLRRENDGRWFDQDGELLHLAHAIDVDLSISPFTNTLPIRRLRLDPGQKADITVAYVGFPSNSVMADPQRYTCVDPTVYHFESVDTDFEATIEVDGKGLVTDYPGLFVRIV